MISDHDRLRGFSVHVDDQLCYQWSENKDPPTIFPITCGSTLTGRVVKFEVPRAEYFTLCEIQIYGMYFGQPSSTL